MQFSGKSRVGFALLAVFVLLSLLTGSAQASVYQNWTGVWITNRGELKLQQEGKTVSGTYCADNGLNSRVEGFFSDVWGFSLRGKYYEGIDSGMFEFRMEESNRSFRGWSNQPGDIWMGKRADDAANPVKQQVMTVINNSPHHVTALFVSPANSEEWREVLEAKELRHGEQRNVAFHLDRSVCAWDIRVVDSNGNFATFQNIRIKPEYTSIQYYYMNGSGQIRFSVG